MDFAFVKDPTTVAAWHTTAMTVVQMHTNALRMSPLHRDLMLWTSGELLTARKERDERQHRNREVVTELRKRQSP